MKIGFQDIKLEISDERVYLGMSAVLTIPMTLVQRDLFAVARHDTSSMESVCKALSCNTYEVYYQCTKSHGHIRKVRGKKGQPAKKIDLGYVRVKVFYTGSNDALFASHLRHISLSIRRELKRIFGV